MMVALLNFTSPCAPFLVPRRANCGAFASRIFLCALTLFSTRHAAKPSVSKVSISYIGMPSGLIAYLSNGRTDSASKIREIESEMARLSHELEVARRSGLAVNKGEAHAVEARIASLAKLIVENEQ